MSWPLLAKQGYPFLEQLNYEFVDTPAVILKAVAMKP